MKTKEKFIRHNHNHDGNGKQYLQRFGKGTKGSGWFSFDHKGTHFIGLNNVMNIREGGLGQLGDMQLEWMEDDLKAVSDSTPVVVFAHVPLWMAYPQWGWGTEDGARALGYLKRFGSLTVLNGHIHQVLKKTEGNATFHTAMSTAFPQPAPGSAPKPGPMKVEAGKLRSVLGITDVRYRESTHSLAIVIGLVAGRLFLRRQLSPGSQRAYLVGMFIASALMLGAGYWGGEMLLHAAPENLGATSVLSQSDPSAVMRGHDLFLLNCAHCHGDDARGMDEAPDLTKFHKSEARIASVVKNGIKGEMPRFGQKLTDADVKMLIRFIRSLNERAA